MQKRRCFAGSGIPHVASIRLELLMFRAWRDRRRRDATQESITDTTPLARTRRDTAVDDEGCAITGETRRRVVNDLHAQMEACIFFGQTGHPIHGTWISYVKSTVDFYPYATRADSIISVTENDLSLGTVNYSGRTRAHLHHGILPPTISGQPGNWALTTASPDRGKHTVSQTFRWNHQIKPAGSTYAVEYYASRISVPDKLFNVSVAGSWSTPRFFGGEDAAETCRYPDGAEAPI